MELRHLHYFVVVAEERHFGRAAERLHMAQPPLSQRIRDLERTLGVRLFHRSRHRVQLTEAGALLLEHARPVLDHAESAREAMRRIRPGTAGELRAGVPPDTRPVVLESLVAGFRRAVPDVLVELHELTTVEQVAALRDGELDAGVVRHPSDTVGLESGQVVSRTLGVLLPENHRAAERETVRLRELNGSPLVIFPRAMAPLLYDHILSVCRDNGFLPSAIRHARNPNFTHGLLLSDLGVHFNEQPPDGPPAGLVWRRLSEARLTWSTSVVWVPSRGNEVVEAFAEAAIAGLHRGGYRNSQ